MKRAFAAAIALGLTACQDRSAPTAPHTTDPLLAIVDGHTNSEQSGFFFLAPIRPLGLQPPEEGEFDPDLSPVVEICELTAANTCGPLISRLTMTDDGLLDRVYVLPRLEEYGVLWRTRELDLQSDRMYRIHVKVGTELLGYADIDVVSTFRQLFAVDRDEFVPLLQDFILPIRFWIGKRPVPSSLTLVKEVINDNGGSATAADWTLSADGPTPLSGAGGAVSGSGFAPGTYTLNETGPSGYVASAWTCTGGVQSDNSITLTAGESAVCTITNNDSPPVLSLVKVVTNDNGGTAHESDFVLTADGPTPISGAGAVASDGAFHQGTYVLSEAGPWGYSASSWSCAGATVEAGNQVTLGLGQVVACTITNDDIPAGPTLYVDNPADFVITTDNAPAGLSNGDVVTFSPSGGNHSAVAGLTVGVNAFASIQAAVNAAVAGDVIRVGGGTFAEAVNVNKPLTLLGNQFGDDAQQRTSAVETVVTGVNNDGRTPFQLTASDVVLDGFTVEGATNANEFGFGIVLGAGTSGSELRNTIVQNNIAGLSLANNNAANPTVIQRNLFRNNNQPGPVSGTAIYTDQFNAGGALSNVLIDFNSFQNNSNVAILLGPTTAASPASDVTVSRNLFGGNGNTLLAYNLLSSRFTENEVASSVGSTLVVGGGVNDLTMTNNILNGDAAPRALRVGDLGGGSPNQNVTFEFNSISNYSASGVEIAAGQYIGTLNAESNWWGSATGPTSPNNPGGTGQAIIDPSNQVDFTPYLTSGVDLDPEARGFQPAPRSTVTTTTLTSDPNPSLFSQAVTFTATVTGSGGTPTGTVQFDDVTTNTGLGTVSLNAAGEASLTTGTLAVGSHDIRASYVGDGAFGGSTATVAQIVNPVSAPSTTTLTSAPNPSEFSQAVTFTATVAGSAGTPTGAVQFHDVTNDAPLGIASLSDGVATLTLTTLTEGSHEIQATYLGDAAYDGSSGTTTHVVNAPAKVPTTTIVTSAPSPSTFPQAVTFTATVTGTGGTPTGTVQFRDLTNNATLGAGSLDAAGIATLTLTTLAVGSHNVQATYLGDAAFEGSAATVIHVVNPPSAPTLYVDNAGDFIITTDNIPAGLSSGDVVTFSPSGGNHRAVSGLTFGTNAFTSIQAAVNAAAAGDIIRIAGGTFAEAVRVNKRLMLLGNQFGDDAQRRSPTVSETVLTGVGNNGQTPIHVSAIDVILDGFTVQNATNASQFGAGVVLAPGTAGSEIRNNIIQDNIVGLFVVNNSPTNQTVIERNLFRNNNQPGPVTGTGIHTDQFLAAGPVTNVLIDNNSFINHHNAAISWASTQASSQSNVTMSRNLFVNNAQSLTAFNLTNSSFTENEATGLTGLTDVLLANGVSNLTITHNILQGSGTTSRALRVSSIVGGAAATRVTFEFNSISGYGSAGVLLDVAAYNGSFAAESNWWGDPTGPTSPNNPGGTGQAIIDPNNQVDFSPYLASGVDLNPGARGFQPTTTTVATSP